MPRPRDDRKRLRVEQLERQSRHQLRVAHAPGHQVQLSRAQGVEQRRVVVRLHLNLKSRQALAQGRERRRQQRRRNAGQRADAKPLGTRARLRHDRLRARIQSLEHAQRMGEQLLPRNSQALNAAPAGRAAFDQPGARQRFQLGQRLGHGRLAQGQAFGCAREVPLLRDRHQATQMAQLHRAHEGFGVRDH